MQGSPLFLYDLPLQSSLFPDRSVFPLACESLSPQFHFLIGGFVMIIFHSLCCHTTSP